MATGRKGNPHIGKFQLSLCHSVQEVKYEACDLHRCSERLSVLTQNKEAFQRFSVTGQTFFL